MLGVSRLKFCSATKVGSNNQMDFLLFFIDNYLTEIPQLADQHRYQFVAKTMTDILSTKEIVHRFWR